MNLHSIQRLKLSNNLFDNFDPFDTEYTAIRKGHRNIQLGELLFVSRAPVEKSIDWDTYIEISGTTFMCQLVKVYEVVHKWFGDVTDKEAQAAGYMNALSWYFQLKRSYPTLDESSGITLIKFNVR